MPSIAILTNAFPYFPGEQFLEDEIPYWGDLEGSEIILLPRQCIGSQRDVPNNIEVSKDIRRVSRPFQMLWMIRALVSTVFLREVKFLRQSEKFTRRNLLRALIATSHVLSIAAQLRSKGRIHDPIDLVYSYWNDLSAYAACLLKRENRVKHVVSRAHRFDLYESRRPGGYMPLKRQFVNDFDAVYLLAEEGRDYYRETYCASEHSLRVAPLGVPVPLQRSARSTGHSIHIVSVSFCVPVKRIDKILEAVCAFSDRHEMLHVTWTHIGAGPLFPKLSKDVSVASQSRENLTIHLTGEMPNADVKAFYLQNPVDVFVNASESEGIPVSIMEAMVLGVPAVAPAVGGIPYLIDEECGVLLSSEPSIEEITSGIERIALSETADEMRTRSKAKISQYFNADKNYPAFITELCELAAA